MLKFDRGVKVTQEWTDVYISEESIVTGDIETSSNIRVDGQIKGNVQAAGNVFIGNNGKVDGSISGMDVHVSGIVDSHVTAAGELVLFPGAKISGEIKAAGIRVEKGASYKGRISIGMAAPAEAAPEEPPVQ